jgi:hypothetical protein
MMPRKGTREGNDGAISSKSEGELDSAVTALRQTGPLCSEILIAVIRIRTSYRLWL